MIPVGSGQIKNCGYRWVPCTSQKKFLGTDGYQVPADKNYGYRWVPGTDGYRVPTEFKFMPTPGHNFQQLRIISEVNF